ncbi:hypothetical protein HYT23_00640 [Candidatus Pacearchaeota archaeon]|nr:hypothetical protein [Candidatus Pacearchaeota archaeon]
MDAKTYQLIKEFERKQNRWWRKVLKSNWTLAFALNAFVQCVVGIPLTNYVMGLGERVKTLDTQIVLLEERGVDSTLLTFLELQSKRDSLYSEWDRNNKSSYRTLERAFGYGYLKDIGELFKD